MHNNIKLKLCFQFFLFLIISKSISAIPVDTSGVYRLLLQQLLMQREQKFSSYSKSLEDRSGIFGNKTKKDILRSNEVLINLVKTDNRIIDVLNRVVDFRNYEKVSMTYNNLENEQQVDNLLRATDTLSKQVTVLRNSNDAFKSKNRRLWWLTCVLSIILGVMLVRNWRKKAVS